VTMEQLWKSRLAVLAAGGAMALDVAVHSFAGHPLTVIGLDELDFQASPPFIVLNVIAHSSFFVAFMWIGWTSWKKR
jgi:hypothetical protein